MSSHIEPPGPKESEDRIQPILNAVRSGCAWHSHVGIGSAKFDRPGEYARKLTDSSTPDYIFHAQQFVQFYNQTFDTNRKGLRSLYRDHSMLTFETSSIQGAKGIVEKLSSLPFKKVEHKVSSLDAQPSDSGAIVILLTGTLLIDEESAMNYTQLFELFPENGSYFVLNDIFRLIYSH
ncbi:unnamed protein product [Penicillium salamii]|nr:unnamed protein product [Penicillium salamii]